jgi:TatA/E family protein of Tat protein translocase
MFNNILFIGGLSPIEIGAIAVIAFLLFGANKLPEMTKSFAQSIKAFKKEIKDVKDAVIEDSPDDSKEVQKKSIEIEPVKKI